MKKICAPAGLGSPLLAAAIALVLSSPVYGADPDSTSGHPAADRATDGAIDRTTISATDGAADRTTTSEGKAADNSARNARDVTGDDLTPLDQSHAAADVETTRSIRKMLVDDDSLGTNAENVKVITVDGMVTLRGAVENTDEQERIVAIATEAAGANRVRNELQVTKR